MSTSKTGKHGHAKVHLVAIDVRRVLYNISFNLVFTSMIQIFTGKKLVRKAYINDGITVLNFSFVFYRRISVLPPTTWMFPTYSVTNTSL